MFRLQLLSAIAEMLREGPPINGISDITKVTSAKLMDCICDTSKTDPKQKEIHI